MMEHTHFNIVAEVSSTVGEVCSVMSQIAADLTKTLFSVKNTDVSHQFR